MGITIRSDGVFPMKYANQWMKIRFNKVITHSHPTAGVPAGSASTCPEDWKKKYTFTRGCTACTRAKRRGLMPQIISYLGEQKDRIIECLSDFVSGRRQGFARVNTWGPDVLDRLFEFAGRGKMIRGALVILSDSLFSRSQVPHQDAVRAAAAIELMQSFLLIHDDIMDQDYLRRGRASVFAQYAKILEKEAPRAGTDEFRRFGEAMGICAGDISMLLAFELFATLKQPPERKVEIIARAAQEIGWVGAAQMNDVYNGMAEDVATEEDITSVYRYKTGRYTFSLPLQLGALLGGASSDDQVTLSTLGEQLGLLFQIKDDDLGIWGAEADTGKPVGSDIIAGKQTLHRLYLVESVPSAERNRVEELFRSGEKSAVIEVRSLLEQHGAQERVVARMRDHATAARRAITQLRGIMESGREILQELVSYSLDRSA